MTAGITYSIPRQYSKFLSGWETSALLRARTGFPVDVLTTENFLGLGFDDFKRPDLVTRRAGLDPSRTIGGRA